MLGLTTLANWFRSAHSLGNELDAKLKQAEADIKAEWNALVARVEALEQRRLPPEPQTAETASDSKTPDPTSGAASAAAAGTAGGGSAGGASADSTHAVG